MDYRKEAEEFPFNMSKESFDGKKTAFVASFYDYPDIVGEGDNAESALDEAYTNLAVYLEYLFDTKAEIKIPTVKDMSKDRGWRITLRMTDKLHEALIARSNVENMSANSVILDALSAYLYSCKAIPPNESHNISCNSYASIVEAINECWGSLPNKNQNKAIYNNGLKMELVPSYGK